jgi:hypothetical protein
MKNAVWRKGLTTCVIAILCSLMVMPVVGHLRDSVAYETCEHKGVDVPVDNRGELMSQELVEVEVTEHRPDGGSNTRLIVVTRSEIEALERDLSATELLEEKLVLLKEYGLIPMDASCGAILAGLKQRAVEMGFVGEMVYNSAAGFDGSDVWMPPFIVSVFSEVSATFRWGASLRLGMTPFLRLLNRYLNVNIPRGIDVVDVCGGLRGSVSSRGLLGEHYLNFNPGCAVLVGFVGYSVKRLFFRHSFYGASVMTFAAGLGSHDFDPWFP